MRKTDRVIILGKVNSSQDGVIVDGGGISPCLTSGHGNCPKILEIIIYAKESDSSQPDA